MQNASSAEAAPLPITDEAGGWREKAWRVMMIGVWLAAIPVAMGFLYLGDGQLRSGVASRLPLLLSIGVSALQITALICHELGHALAAGALGLKPYRVTLGRGALLAEIRCKGLTWVVNSIPTQGYVSFHCPNRSHLRIRVFLTILAGPFVNLLLIVGALALGFYPPLASHFVVAGQAPTGFIFFCVLLNTTMLVENLWPRHIMIEGQPSSSDGLRLWNLRAATADELQLQGAYTHYNRIYKAALRYAFRGPTPSAAPAFADNAPGESALAESPQAARFWRYMFKHLDLEATLIYYRYLLHDADLTPQQRVTYLNNFASHVLDCDARQYYEEALRYTEELATLDNSLATQDTRGCVLIATGQIEAGMSMLHAVEKQEADAVNRAHTNCYLALGAWRLGDRAAAQRWLALSRQLDPDCIPLRRIAQTIASDAS